MSLRVLHVVGARPNFMKIAPLLAVGRSVPGVENLLVHTGQHYDEKMSRLFFGDLGLPTPDVDLEVGSASHARQTASILERFEPVVARYRPDLVVVVGDVNSTLACGLVAAKMGILVAHVEAGLRSFDRRMPEEINRILTDSLSDLLFVSEPSGVDNLRREGADEGKIHFVGNVMIDTLLTHRERASRSTILDDLGIAEGDYAVLTLHRPANVDHDEAMRQIVDPVVELSRRVPVVFPVHPRTRDRLTRAYPGLERETGVRVLDPLGYLDFLKLMTHSRLVLTDSGGIQEETTILGVPCVTLRDNTERPVTLTHGTNRLGGTRAEGIRAAIEESLAGATSRLPAPPLWDGHAAERIFAVIERVRDR